MEITQSQLKEASINLAQKIRDHLDDDNWQQLAICASNMADLDTYTRTPKSMVGPILKSKADYIVARWAK